MVRNLGIQCISRLVPTAKTKGSEMRGHTREPD